MKGHSMADLPIRIRVEITKETDAAYLVAHERGECWLPKSQVTLIDPDPSFDGMYDLDVPEWLALDKGLI